MYRVKSNQGDYIRSVEGVLGTPFVNWVDVRFAYLFHNKERAKKVADEVGGEIEKCAIVPWGIDLLDKVKELEDIKKDKGCDGR